MTTSAFSKLVLPAVLITAAACGGAAGERPIELDPVDTSVGSLTTARQFLQGRWALESFEIYPAGQAPIALKGSGSLTLDDFSNLRMEIRAGQDAADGLRAAGVNIRDGIIASDGRVAIDMQNKTLTYILQSQEVAGTGPLAMNRPRHWQVDGDVLTLTTRDDAGKPASVGRWRKVR